MAITVKHKFVSAIPDGTDATVVRPSNWNDDHDLTGTIPVANGGTGASTAADGLNNLLPSQTGNNGKVLATDGTNATWTTNGSGDVVGPASATDNAVARFDSTTGKLIQNSVVTVGDTGATTGITTLSASTSVTTPIVQATNSAGLSLKNSAGTTQISMGAGGGDNITLSSSTNINGTNAQIDISPTGTGHVHIKPTGVNSIEIAPTFVGEMDNVTIGSITPAAGTFTTITGQTEVLKGTGQNLVVQSQAFATSWANSGLTLANNATTAPDTTNTASSLIETATTAVHWAFTQAALNLYAGTYTASCYLKANGRTAATLAISGNTTNQYVAVTFDLSGVVVSQTNVAGTGFSVTSSSITSVGSGWYRCVLTAAIPARSDYLFMVSISNATTFSPNSVGGANSYLGDITKGIYAWGGQLEPFATVGTYVPTTTTVLLGNPSLSLGGFASLGMENTGAVYLQPALTGALQAQATTSTATGGNARGAYAADFQTQRTSAGRVASGTNAVIGGGYDNAAGNGYSVVAGGYSNSASGQLSAVSGGQSNTASATTSYVGGGYNNTGSGLYAGVVSGYSNTGAGYYNFIGAGYANSGTALAAVTTQSGTMNATTAVTLSGSNANIKVGQLVTGTSITSFPNTYVAAISGTSLTLSQVASGSSTSTLSFYTPHGVVVGGGNNQATGSYSFIGGGGDAGTAANRNIVSGDWSAVVGGNTNSVSGIKSCIGGGTSNAITSDNSVVCGGFGNSAQGTISSVLGGSSNLASGRASSIVGGVLGTTRSITGNTVFSANEFPVAASAGVSQAALLVIGAATTDATATALRSNTSAASGTNQVILPNNSAYFFRGEVVSGVTGGGDTKGWTIEGVIKRGAGVGTTTLVGSTVTSLYADAGAATWTIALAADTTNGGLRVTFTGQAATTIRTVCQIRTTEMTY